MVSRRFVSKLETGHGNWCVSLWAAAVSAWRVWIKGEGREGLRKGRKEGSPDDETPCVLLWSHPPYKSTFGHHFIPTSMPMLPFICVVLEQGFLSQKSAALVLHGPFSCHILLFLSVLSTTSLGWLHSHQSPHGQHQHCSSSASRAQSWLASSPLPSLHSLCYLPESGQQPQNFILHPPATWNLGAHSGGYSV